MQLLFGLLGVAIAMSSIVICETFSEWHDQIRTQRRIDLCVARNSRRLEKTQEEIISANAKIKSLRAAIATASAIQPEAVPAMRIITQGLAVAQDAKQVQWKIRQGEWLMKRGCDGKMDLPAPLPSLAWWRPPEDVLGVQTLQWQGELPKHFRILLSHSPRYSAAEVYSRGTNSSDWDRKWATHPLDPRGFIRSGSD